MALIDTIQTSFPTSARMAENGQNRAQTVRELVNLKWNAVNKNQRTDFTQLSKAALQELADGLFYEDSMATSLCVDFVCSETRGIWHGRARAMMCRRMKHVGLDKNQSAKLVESIVSRLVSGQFSEQFKDQLRLAMTLDSPALFNVARTCRSSKSPHVCAYAEWVLGHDVA